MKPSAASNFIHDIKQKCSGEKELAEQEEIGKDVMTVAYQGTLCPSLVRRLTLSNFIAGVDTVCSPLCSLWTYSSENRL